MSQETSELRPWRSYDAIYNQPDPRAYFRTLEPLGYRQPEVLAGFLRERAGAIAQALGRRRLRLLDFGCGYGALGAVLKHRLLMQDLYGYYGRDAGADFAEADRRFFAGLSRKTPDLELGGIDIAERAVAYALSCGLIDAGFTENLNEVEPGPALAAFFAGTDMVVETGAVYRHVAPCFRRLLEGTARRPWFLLGPRGDADSGPLEQVLRDQGYLLETVSLIERRYRRYSDEAERRDSEANMRALGREVARRSQGGWFLNPLILARQPAEVEALPAGQLGY